MFDVQQPLGVAVGVVQNLRKVCDSDGVPGLRTC